MQAVTLMLIIVLLVFEVAKFMHNQFKSRDIMIVMVVRSPTQYSYSSTRCITNDVPSALKEWCDRENEKYDKEYGVGNYIITYLNIIYMKEE